MYLTRSKCDLACPPHRYRYIRSHSYTRSLLWRMLVIGLKLIKGEFDHISKCWTLISTSRSRCPTILYWINTDINSIILILQCLPLYCVLHLDLVLRTELLISKGELQSLLPYLKIIFDLEAVFLQGGAGLPIQTTWYAGSRCFLLTRALDIQRPVCPERLFCVGRTTRCNQV